MGRPALVAQIAFATDPGAVPTWTDVSAYVRSAASPQLARIRRGRQHELARFDAGTAELRLDNADRRFDPTNAASPLYPNVQVTRRGRISATWSGTTYDLFDGYADAWPPEWPSPLDAEVFVPFTDGFKALALPKLSGSWPQERSDLRVARVLDAASWPAADRDLSTGQSEVQAVTASATPALEHLQAVALTESGRLFLSGDGSVVFHDRHRGYKSPYDASLGTFGDDHAGGELPYSNLQPTLDDLDLWNSVVVTRTGGTAQTATDATSVARHFERTLTQGGTLQTSDNEALAAAQYWLSRYKDPLFRMRGIELRPQSDDNLWPHALGREIGDRITLRRRPPGGGAAIDIECLIEGIEHDIQTTEWVTRWRLSPADVQEYWILNSLTLSVLGSTTKLAY